MILESLVMLGCLYGSTDSCSSGLASYVKHTKLDEKSVIVAKQFKQRYPGLHFVAVVTATVAQKKYNALIYHNVWFEGDYSDNNDSRSRVVFKYTF